MNNRDTRKVEKWIKERQNSCSFIRWRKVEGSNNSFSPICVHEERNEQKCIFKYCPFTQS